MIKLKNIKRNDDVITCEAFVEDCCEPISLSFSVASEEFMPYSFPDGYDWCENHIFHALKFIKNKLKNGEPLPGEKTIMWC